MTDLPFAWSRGETYQNDYWVCDQCTMFGNLVRSDDTPAITHTRLTGHPTRTIWVTARSILPMRTACSPPSLSS